MKELTRDIIEKRYRKDVRRTQLYNKYISVMAKSLVPVFIVEMLLSMMLSGHSFLRGLMFILLFFAADIFIVLVAPVLTETSRLMIQMFRIAGSPVRAFRIMHSTKELKQLYTMFNSDLGSDNLLSEIDAHFGENTPEDAASVLLTMKLDVFISRNDHAGFRETDTALSRIKRSKCDELTSSLTSCVFNDDAEGFIKRYEAGGKILEKLNTGPFSRMLARASLQYDYYRFKGDYSKALENAQLWKEYYEKMHAAPTLDPKGRKPETNREIYHCAMNLLDMAYIHRITGSGSIADQLIAEAEERISAVTCALPEYFNVMKARASGGGDTI